MKILISFCLICLGFVSCTKNDTVDSHRSIIGKWILKQTLADIGDGSGQWESTSTSHIEFKASGLLTEKGFSDLKKYEILDSVEIEFFRADNLKIEYRYKINGPDLYLKPPCIEACGFKFSRLE
jgi:hypothetical protein